MARLARLAQLPLLPRIGVFVLALVLCWLPLALLITLHVQDPNAATIGTMGTLFLLFLGCLWVWGRHVYGMSWVYPYYGLRWRQRNGWELLLGLGLGLGLISLMFGIQTLGGWVTWAPFPAQFGTLLREGATAGLGVGLAEELLFRGWLLDELQRNLRPMRAAGWNAIAFAILHYLKPLPEIWQTLPQFLGLLILGLVLARARQRTGQLGLSIGIHAGLVWGYYLVKVGNWVEYGDRAPLWLIGINENPLAGAIGLLFLTGLLVSIHRFPYPTKPEHPG